MVFMQIDRYSKSKIKMILMRFLDLKMDIKRLKIPTCFYDKTFSLVATIRKL